jgi:hypothetical protein
MNLTPDNRMEKKYSGIVLRKGWDGEGPFVTLEVINQYGRHEMEFAVEEGDLDMYHPGQIATMTCYFPLEVKP